MFTSKRWRSVAGPFVTVTQEEWDSSTEIMNDKQREKKRCGKRARQLDRGHESYRNC